MTKIARLHDVDQLERLLSESHARPVLLFKHSRTCGISAEALDELLVHVNGHGRDNGSATYAVVTVQTHREVANAVTRKLGVRHETPQALLVLGSKVVWSASHFRVTARAVADALTRHGAQ
jgi:bacillithiol system protein YtxJ